jgi:hypothetical protein
MGKGGGCHSSPPFAPLNYACAQPFCEPMSREIHKYKHIKNKKDFFPKMLYEMHT